MADQIEILDLHLRAYVGLNDEEREKLQDVVLNVGLTCDLRAAGATDDLADGAVDYRAVTKDVIKVVDGARFQLLEKLATAVAGACLQHAGVAHVRVAAEKPGALRFARSVRVTIERERGDA